MKATKLKDKVSKILWTDWDPIGVNNSVERRNEYDGYVPSLTKLLINGVDIVKLKSRLLQHCNVDMGLHTELKAHSFVAKKLHDLLK